MNGDVICYLLVNRQAADNPDPANGVNCPPGAGFATREEADVAVAEGVARGSDLIVAELVDRRSKEAP